LELLLMLVLRGVDQLIDDAIMQVEDLVRDRGGALNCQCNQRGVAALRFESGEIGRSHLAALTGDLEKTVLMDLVLDAKRKIERTQSL
jgi:hypothetical protein